MKIEDKKSAIDLTELAIGIVILGVAVTIGAVILGKLGTSQITNVPTYTVLNETVTTSGAGFSLSKGWVKSIDVVQNATSGTVISSGNYSYAVNTDTGIATMQNTTSSFKPNWNVTYTVYNTSDVRYLLPSKAQLGLAEYGNWFKILTIVGIAAVILALIFMALGNRNSGSDGGLSY